MNRETRIGLALVAALGAFVFLMLVIGSLGEPRPELTEYPVGEILAQHDRAAQHDGTELRIVGWYAELAGDCVGDNGGVDASVAWLQRDCPLRVLLSQQPSEDVSPAELERDGLRLAAPDGRPFPSRAQPGGPNLRLQQLVFTGHFNDPAAAGCVPDRVDRCRNTFVVSTYDGLLR
ncbi:MAG: hypothetical protein H0W81_10285 [Chloroflexi bacterium]|nr:hypothetical protein [Chloroflexota bacterium]